jgi:hypothetical protein
MTDSFGARLRAARERRSITLDAIAHTTKIHKALFEGLERDDTTRWPSGIFRRAFVRAYAEAVGLDAEAIVAEFLRRFPEAPGEARTAGATGDQKSVTWHDSLAVDPATRLTLADDTSAAPPPERTIEGWPARALVAAVDLAAVAAMAVAFALAGRLSTLFAIATALYYLGGVLGFGTSLGAWLVGRSRATAAAETARPARTFTPRLVSRTARHTAAPRPDQRVLDHSTFAADTARSRFARRTSN